MSNNRTLYSYLQVTEDASIEVIKGAYKHLSQKYHPDKNPDNREKCEGVMRMLNEAYRILSNSEMRKEYDQALGLEREWMKEKEQEARQRGQEQARQDFEEKLRKEHEEKERRSREEETRNQQQENYRKEFEEKQKGEHEEELRKSKGKEQKGTPKSKTTAGILAILFGGLGLHRFYLGQWWGIFYLLFAWAGVPGIIALVEGIVFLFTSNENWERKYGNAVGGKVFIIVAVILSTITVGVLAAIAVPAYQDYSIRTMVKEGVKFAESLKENVETYAVKNQAWPDDINDIGGLRPSTPSGVDEHGVIQDGIIYIVFSESSGLNAKILGFVPSVDDKGYIFWECKTLDIQDKYLPKGCRQEQTKD